MNHSRKAAPAASTSSVYSHRPWPGGGVRKGMHQHPISEFSLAGRNETRPGRWGWWSSCKLSSKHESPDLLRSTAETLETPTTNSGRGGGVLHGDSGAVFSERGEDTALARTAAAYAQTELPGHPGTGGRCHQGKVREGCAAQDGPQAFRNSFQFGREPACGLLRRRR